MNKYIPGMGNPSAKILFLGEAPSYEEEAAGKPFVGPAGRVFDDCLKNAGIKRDNVWVTNVFKKMIMSQAKSGKKIPATIRAQQAGLDVNEAIQELRTEIDEIRPNVIVPLGGTALWALRGTDKIMQWRGSILPAWNYKIVSTFHPAAIIHGEEGGLYWWKYIIEFDFKRALSQSGFREIVPPYRNLQVCRTSAQLQDFYNRAKERANGRRIKLAVDIEAIRCVPVCISLSFDRTEGLCVPLWNKTPLLRISNIPSSDLASIWQILYQILNDGTFLIVGQNFKYDEDKINRLGFTIPRLYSDTMLKAFAIDPELPVGLAFNTSIYTEEPYYKDEGLDFDYTKQNIDDLFIYGARDAPVTLEIDDAMDPVLDEIGQRGFFENFLMNLHPLYLNIENTGMWQNLEVNLKLMRKYIAWSEKLKLELWKLTGVDVNVNSPKQVSVLLYDVMKLPRRQGTGEEVLTALLPIVKKKDHIEVLDKILDKRRVDKTIGNYLMALPDYDGRMKTSYFLCLKTGRTGTGMLEPPIRPHDEYKDVMDNKKKKKFVGAAFQVFTKHGDIGNDVREQYEPDKGYVFVNLDSSQAEARVIARLCNDEKMLALYDNNDVHALTVSWFLGGDEAKYSKKVLGYECPERFLGKTLRHAGHLGASKGRAKTEVNTSIRKYRIPLQPVNEGFCELALRVFHAKSPAIRNVFHAEVQSVVNTTRVLIAPLPYGVEAKFGGRRTFYERHGDELYREAYSYIPQRAISDNTKAAAIRSRNIIKGLKIVVESHDSLTLMVREKDVDEHAAIVREEMQRPINFENCSLPRKELIIPCEVEIGYNYCDLKKYKVKL